MTAIEDAREIVFPPELYDQLVSHCLRKLRQEFREDETPERKAYGLVGGRIDGNRIVVTQVFPLRRNARWDPQYREDMDRLMDETAIRSETPLDRRGWVADPRELFEAHKTCDREGTVLCGTYHMHRVPWPHDPLRDTCTEIDTRLAARCGMWVLIVSAVDPGRPIVRAFFEGRNEQEAEVRIAPCDGPAPISERGER